MARPVVAIVGRPNVGKSTLFNRFVGTRSAIVESVPGVTRDRLYGEAQWLDKHFTVVDTGGIELDTTDDILVQTKQQAEIAIEEADVIVFVVDGRQGITPVDEEIALLLRRWDRPVIVAANKIDSPNFEANIYEFYQLGFSEVIGIAAEHGRNVGDLLDQIISHFPADIGDEYDPDIIKVAVIGRPNVGKSSIVNAILGEDRMIVSDVPGTTRDAIDTPFTWDGTNFVIIDTAGMRRRKKIEESVERYSVVRALRAVDRCDVAVLVLDSTEEIAEQDKRLLVMPTRPVRLLFWPQTSGIWWLRTARPCSNTRHGFAASLPSSPMRPLTFVSALTGQRLTELLEIIRYVAQQHSLRVTTGKLNEVIQEAVTLTEPPSDKGVRLRIFYAHQAGVKPPVFLLYVNHARLFHFSYKRYIENQLRENFGFAGTPIRLIIKERRGKGDRS